MKYLGIDFGSKRVGLAVSDETNSFAFPLSVLENSNDLVLKIVSICKEKDIDYVIVGESRNFSMKENEIMGEIKVFVKNLEKEGLKVEMHPEFLTSSSVVPIAWAKPSAISAKLIVLWSSGWNASDIT